MKRLIADSVCVLCCLHAVCANAANPTTPAKKLDPAQPVAIPWNDLSARAASLAKQAADRPTVQARGPVDTFTCTPEQYCWLLDNPDRAVTAWRRLGAKCVSIQRRGPGIFGYTDEAGSDVSWEVIHQAPGVRIWFAEGKVKPSPVLPLVPVKALVVLRFVEGKTPEGSTMVQHHAEVVIHTDSKAATAVTKMMGQSAPKLAEQGLGQLQLFFSALSCYVGRHPDRVDMLFRPEK
ncbi:MAG: hypothetical protein HY289_00480 [Planctomycetes bacterium]|nr:hypothetical protein [Planctomycetota bacterium]